MGETRETSSPGLRCFQIGSTGSTTHAQVQVIETGYRKSGKT